MIPAIKPYAIE
jgi:hypothetical protein